MLAYRHAFHAGNHADVLKHLVLCTVLARMGEKDKPYTYIDTHAGAGGYSLQGRYAQKKAEFAVGIARVWDAPQPPQPLADLVERVRAFNGGGALQQYPGSPALAQMLLRPADAMRLYELHPTDHRILHAYLQARPHTKIAMSDGFAALRSDLPPTSRRGVVLIDPPYELKSDYTQVLTAVREALGRFAQAVVMVWSPQVGLVQAAQLPKRLQAAAAAAPRGWLHAQLSVQAADARGFGLSGSHMTVINPPHGLHAVLQECLPWLVTHLGQHEGARHVLEQHAP
jgi:23S rRNA (adenine2030-N6)-methyltransferase